MTERRGYLVVGGDSLVGGGLISALNRRGHLSYATTRRRAELAPGKLFLDFENPEPFIAPADAGYAFVIAAATNYDRCETDPQAAVINVELVPRTVEQLLKQGLFVTFISTNSVFGGEMPWPHEDAPHSPQIAYARQKSDGENAVRGGAQRLGAANRFSIVRLTKIMNAGVSPLPAWFNAWKRDEPIAPFADLVFAPISERFVGEALATIGEARVPGNLHLSGAGNVDYVAFANALAARLHVDAGLIQPTTAVEKGVHIAFKPRYSGLGMTRTTQLSGIRPQRLDDLIDDVVADMNKRSED